MNIRDFGETMDETTLRRGLRELCPDLVFDPAGSLGYYHPQLQSRMGVWHHQRHICAMERGADIPEYNVWALVTNPDGTKRRSHIVRVGWRHTMQKLVNKVPDITWERLQRKFGIDYKVFVGDPAELEVA